MLRLKRKKAKLFLFKDIMIIYEENNEEYIKNH